MEDEEKGIKLKLEVKEEGRIAFLDVELNRGKKNEKIRTKWYQKEENAGIFCNWRSDVDKGTKRNLVKNIEKKIRKLTTEEKEREKLEERLWSQLGRNGYGKKKEEGRRKEDGKGDEKGQR